ncbi:hypothetical protein LP52_21395 [Streptomonospora alba]|uniref:HTH gntR-type domain-containing protein n=1 Tax=Streptomonospora alba TaxID=183763 RepID=A0A0C2FCW1_9ACTN|nr:GntR family transcriptional regulator [Streptomonospora alba]KIH97009.1 hypothetical protein LP52_21395 [Streptomonospora alba]
MAALSDEIADDLVRRINQGEIEPGRRLPTEDELMKRYGVSLNTVRRALDDLAQRGRIVKQQGSGSRVPERLRPTVHLASAVRGLPDDERYTRYLERLGGQLGEPRLALTVTTVKLEDAERIARLLKLDRFGDKSDLWRRRCDRIFGAKLWERQDSYYPGGIAAGTRLRDPVDIEEGTREVLASLGFPQTWSWDVIRAEMPSHEQQRAFGIGRGVPLLVQERLAYGGDSEHPERPVRYTETVMPADRHQLMYTEGATTEDALEEAMAASSHPD